MSEKKLEPKKTTDKTEELPKESLDKVSGGVREILRAPLPILEQPVKP